MVKKNRVAGRTPCAQVDRAEYDEQWIALNGRPISIVTYAGRVAHSSLESVTHTSIQDSR